MSFLEELNSRLLAKQSEWEKCREDVRIAKEKESRLRDEISALQILLNAERPKDRKILATVAPTTISAPESNETNKAEAVRALIHENVSTGLTPPRIRELLEQKNIRVGASYIYGILIRAKKSGQVTERGGRYYPIDKEKAAS